jgi:hypothetical protein
LFEKEHQRRTLSKIYPQARDFLKTLGMGLLKQEAQNLPKPDFFAIIIGFPDLQGASNLESS